ncbi:MAG: TraB/GumN family protein [Filimonas sp.]|nr:TraB/GumN family protein [Filimonas sp.]
MVRNLLLFTLLLLVSTAFGQAPKEKTLLWEISGKGISKPSYLYGTYHLVCPNDLQVSPVITQKFATTQRLFLELDMDEPGMQMKTMQFAIMQDSSTLKSLLGKDYDSVAALFTRKTSLPMAFLGKIKPAVLGMMLYPSMMNCTPEGWEMVFMQLAKDRKMDIAGLETVEFQMGIFDSIPYKEQALQLKEMLYKYDSLVKENKKMIQLYKNKDLPALYAQLQNDKDMKDYEDVLLIKRNKSWIPTIETETKKQPIFIAVGAGHLAGKNGVIALLRKKGYTVKPVMY